MARRGGGGPQEFEAVHRAAFRSTLEEEEEEEEMLREVTNADFRFQGIARAAYAAQRRVLPHGPGGRWQVAGGRGSSPGCLSARSTWMHGKGSCCRLGGRRAPEVLHSLHGVFGEDCRYLR